jgi:hypothetical protein
VGSGYRVSGRAIEHCILVTGNKISVAATFQQMSEKYDVCFRSLLLLSREFIHQPERDEKGVFLFHYNVIKDTQRRTNP